MFTKQLVLASLFITSIAQAQSPDHLAMNGLSAAPSPSITETVPPSFFTAQLRGAFSASATGEGQFGVALAADHSPAAFGISLGACSPQGAILFTRIGGAPLGIGRYRITTHAKASGEILALVVTGPPTKATGAFRGQSGWLEVTAASDQFIAGRFEIDALGFLAAVPQAEDQRLQVTGSFAATATSSGRVCTP